MPITADTTRTIALPARDPMTLAEQITAATHQWLEANPGKTRADLARKMMPDIQGASAQVLLCRWCKGTHKPSDARMQALANETGATLRKVDVKVFTPNA